MKTWFRVGLVSVAVLLGLIAQPPPEAPPPSVVYGQPGEASAPVEEAEDVPGRGVARISLVNGDVSVRRGDSDDVVAAAINAALVAADRVLTGASSRTELQMDAANQLRLAANSDLRLAQIDYRRYTVELGRGTMTWHVGRTSGADIDINTPSISIRPTQPGDYRITVNDDGTTEVTARTGEAEVYSPRGVEKVRRGQTVLVRGDKADPEFQTVAEIGEDDWDRFNLNRDGELEQSESRQYLADDVMGAEELDQNGTWVDSAPYGRVWQPRVAADWSPYSQGRWVWLDYYGWSWVSYDQFGWAPFHYGSWFHQSSGWCWYPGPRQSRTWWRPAMVAWFGFGGVNVGVGFGNWGWVPLAPFERFRPWYGRGFYGNNRGNFHQNIRVVNHFNIGDNYRNARIAGGARGVAAGQFGRVGGRYDRVGEANLRSAGLMRGQLPATPTRESLAFNDRRVGNAGHRAGYEGSFYQHRPTAARERVPFAEQQRGVEQANRAFRGDPAVRGSGSPSNGSPSGFRGGNSVVADSTARERGVRGEAGPGADNGWRRIGERSNGAGNSARGDNNGWRRFGEPANRAAEPNRQGGAPVRGSASGGSGREIDPAVRGNGASAGGNTDANGWRRFGEPTPQSSSFRGSTGERVRGESGFNRGDAGSNGAVRGAGSGGENFRQPLNVTPAVTPAPAEPNSGYRGGANHQNRSDFIRVNPPVLRDRSDSGAGAGRQSTESGGNTGMRGNRGNGEVHQTRPAPAYGDPTTNRGGHTSFGGSRGGNNGGGPSRGGSDRSSGGNTGASRGGQGSGQHGGGHRR